MRSGLAALLFLLGSLRAAERPQSITLFDFEEGVSAWCANPWSGGKGFVEPAPTARFGRGALRARYEQIPQGCNMISPYLPADAPWRTGDYDRICFWLKGDGTQSYLNLYLASQSGDLAPTHTGRVPLDSQEWRRCSLKFDTLWNREDQPFRLKDLTRMYFGTTGTHDVLIDHVSLQRPLRPVPLVPEGSPGPAELLPELYANAEGRYLLTLDPAGLPEPTVTAAITVTWSPQAAASLTVTLPTRAASEEVWITLPGSSTAAGQGRLSLRLSGPDGKPCTTGLFSFPVVLAAPRLDPDPLELVPRPKELTLQPGSFELPPELEVQILSQPAIAEVGSRYLERELSRWFGRTLRRLPAKLPASTDALLVLAPAGQAMPPLSAAVSERLPGLRQQGYTLQVSPQGIVLAARDEAGMRNAAITLMQMLRAASPSAEEVRVPWCTIVDWPSLPIRAVNLGLPTSRWGHPNDAPVPVDFFIDYLRRTVVEQKVNVVGLEVLQGMKFDKHPEIAGPAAYGKDEVRRIVDFLKDNGVEVFPLVNSLGHANWLVIPRRELREDDDEHTLCTRNPQIRGILQDVYEEVIEVFRPRYLHVGLDEIRWVTDSVAPEKRCKLCTGLDKRELFVEHVTWLHEFATSRNLQLLMWADMLLDEHNGGPPYHLADTLDRLPQDIILCDWSATLAPRSLWELNRRGFTVWKSNSRGVNAAQFSSVAGNLWGIWSRVPWLTEAAWPALEFSYLNQSVAAEYGWNPYSDLMADGVPLSPEFFRARPQLHARLAAEPVPRGARTVEPVEPGPASLDAAGLRLQPFAEPVTAAKTFPVGKPAAAVYALLTAELPPGKEERAKFLDAFKQKTNWQGVPIGELVLTYVDAQTATLPIRYGYNVRGTTPAGEHPQAYAALGTVSLGDRLAYLVQWTNPSPDLAIREIRFAPGALAAKPALAGLAIRAVRPR
jgi:hypothetical protein